MADAACDCEWMFGDAATGMLGFNELAGLNPLRWSASISFGKAVRDIRAVEAQQDRPIVVKVPPGIGSKEHRFATCQEAIAFLESHDPRATSAEAAAAKAKAAGTEAEAALKAVADAKKDEKAAAERKAEEAEAEARRAAAEALSTAKALLTDHETFLEDAVAEAKKAEDACKKIEEERITSDVECKWMFFDSGVHAFGVPWAQNNPFRWSKPQPVDTTVEELTATVDQGERPISLRAPADKDPQIFDDQHAAVKHLYSICPKHKERHERLNVARDMKKEKDARKQKCQEQAESAKAKVHEAIADSLKASGLPARPDQLVKGETGAVVLVHGLASASLQTRRPDEDSTWQPSYIHISALLKDPKKLLGDITCHLVKKDGEYCAADPDGVEVRPYPGVDGIAQLNPSDPAINPPIAVWKGLVDKLNGQYYLVSFNYDWRKWGCPSYSESLPKKFALTIEGASASGPVTVVTHSMGAPVALFCISKLGASWQQKYIKNIILVAPAPMGSTTMIPSFGNNPVAPTDMYFNPPENLVDKIGDIAVTWPALVSEFPVPVGGIDLYPDHPLVIMKQREYRSSEMGEFVQKLSETVKNRETGPAFWPSVSRLASQMSAPAVATSIIYSSSEDTPTQFSYLDVEDDLSRPPKVTMNEKGDNTILASSIEKMARHWSENGADVSLLNTSEKHDHRTIIVADETVKLIEKLLTSETGKLKKDV